MARPRDISEHRLRLPRVPPGLDATLSRFLQDLVRGLQEPDTEFAHAARVARSSGAAVNNSTAIPWNSETFDSGGLFTSTADTRLTAHLPGVYAITAGENVGVLVQIRLNGATSLASNSRSIAALANLVTDDYVELVNVSGSSQTFGAGTYLAMARLATVSELS